MNSNGKINIIKKYFSQHYVYELSLLSVICETLFKCISTISKS